MSSYMCLCRYVCVHVCKCVKLDLCSTQCPQHVGVHQAWRLRLVVHFWIIATRRPFGGKLAEQVRLYGLVYNPYLGDHRDSQMTRGIRGERSPPRWQKMRLFVGKCGKILGIASWKQRRGHVERVAIRVETESNALSTNASVHARVSCEYKQGFRSLMASVIWAYMKAFAGWHMWHMPGC